MKSRLYLIIRREYLERVSRKSFLLTTILMPIFMVALMALPSLILLFSGPESKTIAVVDYSNVIGDKLKGDKELVFNLVTDSSATINTVKESKDFDALLIINRDVIDDPNSVHYYTKGAPSMQTEMFISNQISDAVKAERIKRYDIDNLGTILSDLDVNVSMDTKRIDTDEVQETSSVVSYFIGFAVSFMLYMFILLYGQMVMTSIIEEKNNRVLEIVVSSVKPQTLMLGKILGVGLVALTQILIWAVLIGAFTKWVMPIFSAGLSTADPEVVSALSQLSNVGFIMQLFGYIIIFMVLGFLFYAAIFAAVGSAVDNINDASQLTSLATIPIIIGLVFSMTSITDPNTSMAFWLSMIPFTSPMVMMSRIPFGIPSWEIWLSIGILILGTLGIVWLAAKIYRVGIFMYGKKPTFKDLIRWARYK